MLLRILVVVLICSNFLFSQNKELIKQLTNTVINENDNDSIKTTKIYKWIIDNIEYNTKIFKTQKLQSIEEILDKKVHRTRVTVIYFQKC